jgi:hypothetical protein
MVSWILLAFFAGLAFLLGAITWRRAPEKAKARAAVRTSRFALALPSFLFVLVTSFSWAGLFSVGQEINDPFLYARGSFTCGRVSRDACPRWLARVGEYFDVFPNVGMAEGFRDCEARKPVCTGPQKDSHVPVILSGIT